LGRSGFAVRKPGRRNVFPTSRCDTTLEPRDKRCFASELCTIQWISFLFGEGDYLGFLPAGLSTASDSRDPPRVSLRWVVYCETPRPRHTHAPRCYFLYSAQFSKLETVATKIGGRALSAVAQSSHGRPIAATPYLFEMGKWANPAANSRISWASARIWVRRAAQSFITTANDNGEGI